MQAKVIIRCDFCGAQITKYKSQIKKHNFCSRSCLAAYSSKSKNPAGYADLKSYKNMSENMKRLNGVLNAHRMTTDVRIKLHVSRTKDPSERKSYQKFFGRHIHRIVAEKKIGRKLKPGEVVHHIDGNKQNNSPENLMVFSNQAEHARWHAGHKAEKAGDVK